MVMTVYILSVYGEGIMLLKWGGTMIRRKSIEMLKSKTTPDQYIRTVSMIGVTGHLMLLKAKVAVVGAGQQGGTVAELLAKIGVGHIRVIDGERFTGYSYDRHFLNSYKNIGRNKAEAVVEYIAHINSDITVQAVPVMLVEENAGDILNGVDVIVDALDYSPFRLLVARAARESNTPLVYAAVDGWTGQVTTIYPDDMGLGGFCAREPGRGGKRVASAALAAALEVQEVIKIITGKGEVIRNRLLFFDIERGIFEFLPAVGESDLFIHSEEQGEHNCKVWVKS